VPVLFSIVALFALATDSPGIAFFPVLGMILTA